MICEGGQCATGSDWPKIVCSGSVIDPMSDNNNCGACGIRCDATAGLLCTAGTCSCVGGMIACGKPARCVHTATDPNNCGACGAVCPTGQSCTSGTCACGCAAGRSCCPLGVCVDLQSDNANCGACGIACDAAAGLFCVAGKCACVGGTTLVACGVPAKCVDTTTDNDNCGACGHKCSPGDCGCKYGQCIAGSCVSPNKLCGSCQCVDVVSDQNHCGGCGIKCTGGKTCVAGKCNCPASVTDCSGTCANLLIDPKNCGVCGKTCSATETCQAGACGNGPLDQLQVSCAATDLPVAGKTQCTANLLLPGGSTVPVTADGKLTWIVVMEPAAPLGCASLTLGSFSTAIKGELQIASDPQLATLGCSGLVSATYAATPPLYSNNVTITFH